MKKVDGQSCVGLLGLQVDMLWDHCDPVFGNNVLLRKTELLEGTYQNPTLI